MKEIETDIREYAEEMPVTIGVEEAEGSEQRTVVKALNECGHNCTKTDLLDLLRWASVNMPEEYARFAPQNHNGD